MKKGFVIILGLIFLSAGTARTKSSLKPVGCVNDFAGILTGADKARIETLITETEKKTSAEIAVVTIDSLEGANLEEFANELFNSWGIGKKGKGNGALILVVKNERKIRIETGYGLEPILPDGKCGEIIRKVLTPAFRKGEFGEGLFQAVELIAKIIGGEDVPVPSSVSTEKVPVVFLIFFCVFFILIVNSIVTPNRLKRIKKRYGRDWREHWYWWYGSASSGSGGGGGFGGGGGGFGGGGGGGGGASGGW